jgi:antitoxin component of RelBE/YafQ-DinJ toxin-antitoxin module
MKKFTKDYTLSIRVNGELVDRIDALTESFSLDRADLIRMLLSNAVKYWEQKFNSTGIPQPVDKKTGYVNQALVQEIDDLEERLKALK